MESEEEIRRKLSEKFSNYEPEPGENSWEKIRTSVQLSQMFQTYEANPEDESWEKIRAGIDLAQRMKEYEPEPQGESWEKIQAGVDLAQKFKNYEAEPQAISWLKIQEAIQQKKRRRGIIIPLFYRAGIAAGLVLLLGSLWWLLTRPESVNQTALNSKLKKTAASDINPKSKNRNALKTLLPESAVKPTHESTVAAEREKLAARTSENRKQVTPADRLISDKGNSRGIAGKARKTRNEQLLVSDKGRAKVNRIDNLKKPVLSTEANNPTETLASAAVENLKSEASDITPDELSGKPFQQRPVRKPFGAIAYNAEKPFQEKAQRIHRDIVFNASLMPLQTYQAFTILPQTNTYIQQVGRLDAIDNQRLGVQLRAGAMKPLSNRFAMGVSATYTGLQQWANYELNSGEYEVQTATNGSYTLVGIGEQVSQKQFMQTIGLKLDNAYLVNRKKTKVYAIAGAEAVHVLNNKDFGYYVNASVGLSYPIKGGKSLWVEPTFRYSLSQSFDANNYLKIRPYNIGLNLRINFI